MEKPFLKWLDQELARQGLTKNQLAERISYSTTLVYQIAMGDRNPTAEFMIACARALNADPVAVLRLAGILPPAPGDTDDAYLAECWAVIQRIPAEHRATVMLMLRAVATS